MRCGAAMCWASRKIKVICLSSAESEICAGVAATKDVTFVRNILTFMWCAPSGPTPLLIDNEAMWFNVRNTGVSARTRHWELWQHYVRDAYERLVISVHKVGTNDEVADLFTKPLPKDGKFASFRDYMLNTVNNYNI